MELREELLLGCMHRFRSPVAEGSRKVPFFLVAGEKKAKQGRPRLHLHERIDTDRHFCHCAGGYHSRRQTNILRCCRRLLCSHALAVRPKLVKVPPASRILQCSSYCSSVAPWVVRTCSPVMTKP